MTWTFCVRWPAREEASVNERDLPDLRRLARQAGLTPAALKAAQECGLFADDETAANWTADLRRMRRLMDQLGVNAPGAALLVRMRHDMELMQRRLMRLNRLEARWFDEWED